MKQLNKIKDSGFKTPENYFNDLEHNLLSEIKNNETIKDSGFKPPKLILLKKNYRYIISSIAAAVLLLIVLTRFESPLNLDLVENETIENYILEEFEADEMAHLFEDNQLYEIDFMDSNLIDTIIESTIENGDDFDLYNAINLYDN